MKDISILVEAKKRYIEQLQQILVPRLYEGFESIYDNALELLENEFEEKNQQSRSIARVFQEALKEIPLWNQDIINHECDRIIEVSNCDYFEDLIEAVFIAESKILTVVQNNKHKNKTKVHVPRASHFIHRCYISAAREIYKNPYVFNHSKELSPQEKHNNVRYTLHMLQEGISNAIRELLPIRDILKQGFIKNLDAYESDQTSNDSDLEIDYSDKESKERSRHRSKERESSSDESESSDESSESESESESENETEYKADIENKKDEMIEEDEENDDEEEEIASPSPIAMSVFEKEESHPQESIFLTEVKEKESEEEQINEKKEESSPLHFSSFMNQIQNVFTSSESKPTIPSTSSNSHLFDEDDEVEEIVHSTDKEPIHISFDDDESIRIPVEENDIKQIHLDGNRIPKEYRTPPPESQPEPQLQSQTSVSTEIAKIEDDQRSVASSGILYRSEPKRESEDRFLTLEKLKKKKEKEREREREMRIRKHRPASHSTSRDDLYQRTLENYKRFHTSGDNESNISGVSSIAPMNRTQMIDSYLRDQREKLMRKSQDQNTISYVVKRDEPKMQIQKMQSDDEYESDQELSHA